MPSRPSLMFPSDTFIMCKCDYVHRGTEGSDPLWDLRPGLPNAAFSLVHYFVFDVKGGVMKSTDVGCLLTCGVFAVHNVQAYVS